MMNAKEFVIDYIGRHKHPVNACLHIVGVPVAFYGMFLLLTGQFAWGAALTVAGYFLQYLGHKAQGNEVGEVTLVKHIWKKISTPRNSETTNE